MIFCGFGLMLLSQMIQRNHATLLKRTFLLLTSTHFSMTTCGKNEFLKRSGKPKHQKTNIANSEWFALESNLSFQKWHVVVPSERFFVGVKPVCLSGNQQAKVSQSYQRAPHRFFPSVPCRGSWMLFLLARSRPLVDHSPDKTFSLEETREVFGPKSRGGFDKAFFPAALARVCLGAFGFSFWVAFKFSLHLSGGKLLRIPKPQPLGRFGGIPCAKPPYFGVWT